MKLFQNYACYSYTEHKQTADISFTHNAINITIAYISKVAIDQSVRLGYSNTIEQL